MKLSRFFLPGLLSVLAFAGMSQAQQDAPGVNADAILRHLEQIEQQQKQAEQSARISTISQLKTAAASGPAAANLFEKAMEATQFDGIRNKGASFADWKSSKSELLRNKEFLSALQLHIRYLVLSIERKASDKPELFVSPSLAYAGELISTDDLFLRQAEAIKAPADKKSDDLAMQKEAVKLKDELLNKALSESIFVKWLRLTPWLPKADEWELVPGNLPGILEKNVRAALRKAKSPQLLETWELETKFLADRVTFSRLEHQTVEFNGIIRPRLQFARANDMVELGQKNRAINEIYAIVKDYPQHPDFAKWVQRLRELLKPAAPAEATEAPAQDAVPPAN